MNGHSASAAENELLILHKGKGIDNCSDAPSPRHCSPIMLRLFLGVFISLFLSDDFSSSQMSQRTFIVNTTDDNDDGHCDSLHCSLREAINSANAQPGSDLIIFDSGVFPLSQSGVIKPVNVFPAIYDSGTEIDATGAGVIIDGENLTLAGIEGGCFNIHNSNRTVLKGMKIQNFPGWSTIFIHAYDGGEVRDNKLIGLILLKNGFGLPHYVGRGDAITITTNGNGRSACNNKIISCLIEGNADDGIAIEARDGGICNSNLAIANIIKNNAENGIEIDSEGVGSSASRNTIANNTIKNHQYHISLFLESYSGAKTDNNIICSNSISSGKFNGIEIASSGSKSSSKGNRVVNNQIRNNEAHAITVGNDQGGLAIHTVIKGNTCAHNGGIGINLTADGGRIYHNNIDRNKQNGNDSGNDNIWNEQSRGNYWSDYEGQDDNGDGIGDTPYSIFPNGQDYYPLMTKSLPLKSAAPKNLKAIAFPGGKIMLNWECRSQDVYGFVIHRKEKLGNGWEWIPIKWTESNAHTYTDTGLTINALYLYRVQSYNPHGYSLLSEVAKATTF